MESLAALKPAFKEDGVIHAGNSLGHRGRRGGGAARLRAQKARQLGLKPRARIVSTAMAGSDPVLMLTGPIPSTRRRWRRPG